MNQLKAELRAQVRQFLAARGWGMTNLDTVVVDPNSGCPCALCTALTIEAGRRKVRLRAGGPSPALKAAATGVGSSGHPDLFYVRAETTTSPFEEKILSHAHRNSKTSHAGPPPASAESA